MNWDEDDCGNSAVERADRKRFPGNGVPESIRRVNFVTPAPAVQPTRVEILPPTYDLPVVQPSSRADVEIHGTYRDRAAGFQLVTLPLAGAVAVGSLIVGIVGFSVPVFSVAALAWLWGGFLVTWLAAWLVHNVVSPDGNAVLHTLFGWWYLFREQDERHKRYRGN